MQVIKVIGADTGSNNIGRSALLTSNREGLVGEYLLSKSAAASIQNTANSDKPLTVVGEPVFNPDHVVCSSPNWFETGLYETAELTAMVVCDAAVNGAFLLGTFAGSTGQRSMMMWQSALLVLQGHGTDANGTNPTENSSSVAKLNVTTDFRIVAGRISSGADYTLKLDQYKGGVQTSSAATVVAGKTRAVNGSRSIAIGSPRGAVSPGGLVKIAAVLLWARRFADAELASTFPEVAAQVKALRGLVL
ncbi:hypothetical protein DFR41_104244 [Pseudacidovorax intermedius]|uniref:Uncharacterized protein n=1 Tax=Pseudacidovorax intermedius TaxID=433924 RepID=A0A370FFJ3_9BURK|nr:hypothetical protein [Pseudacidovorax intermedius]RDI25187.1 hypothetical protein DFR41_104244 [Pseudacidovorax intermedius]